ncbi:hypothetical protein HanIR_Chr08g0373241 [Helianthus annuus]|nr:hypothetical protein HanIR_Chr08g0373241 [Helianthus annuus]
MIFQRSKQIVNQKSQAGICSKLIHPPLIDHIQTGTIRHRILYKKFTFEPKQQRY